MKMVELLLTDHFSGPGRATGMRCVCVHTIMNSDPDIWHPDYFNPNREAKYCDQHVCPLV